MLTWGMLISALKLPFNDFTQAQVLQLNERKVTINLKVLIKFKFLFRV